MTVSGSPSPASVQASSIFLTRSVLERSANAKIKLEKYYETLLQQAVERESRRVQFEADLRNTATERQPPMVQKFSKAESDFLHLKRVKLSVLDFQTIKVIGKGAFGEVGVAFFVCFSILLSIIGAACTKN